LSTTFKSLPTSFNTSAESFVKDCSTFRLLTSKTSETILLAEELVDVLFDSFGGGGSDSGTIDFEKRLASLSVERIEAVERPVARLDGELGVLDKVGAATFNAVLDARAVAEDEGRARIVISFSECLHCLSRVGIETNGSDVDVAVSHCDGAEVLLCAILATSSKLVNATFRSSL